MTVEGLGACHSNPCMHDGRCVDIINNNDPDLHFDYDHDFKCFCSALYSGVLCEGIVILFLRRGFSELLQSK